MFDYSKEEKHEVLMKYFSSSSPLVLEHFPKKLKRKYIVCLWISDMFEKDKKYDEKAIDDILKKVYSDYVTLRRYLVDFNLLDRTMDGRAYWRI